MRSSSPVPLAIVLLLASVGCGSESASSDSPSPEELTGALDSVCDGTVAAGDGWLNRPVPSATGTFSASWRSSPGHVGPGSGPIDAVMGFARGAADAFTDLGPIVRFGPGGSIDARNGAAYAGGFPYTFGDGPYEFQLLVDIVQHRYSVWVRHLDSPFKPFEVLAQDFAFRHEQRSVAQLDHIATIVDSPSGALQNCGYAHEPPSGCVHSGPGAWRSRPFATLNPEQAHLDFYAWVTGPAIDAVIGTSLGAPARFSDLSAIVRFHPDGHFDARNGSAYAADADVRYLAGVYYRVTLDLDLAQSTYSVLITPPDGNSVVLAHDYAFRTEQLGVASLDHLGQFVDGTAGTVHTCALVAR